MLRIWKLITSEEQTSIVVIQKKKRKEGVSSYFNTENLVSFSSQFKVLAFRLKF